MGKKRRRRNYREVPGAWQLSAAEAERQRQERNLRDWFRRRWRAVQSRPAAPQQTPTAPKTTGSAIAIEVARISAGEKGWHADDIANAENLRPGGYMALRWGD